MTHQTGISPKRRRVYICAIPYNRRHASWPHVNNVTETLESGSFIGRVSFTVRNSTNRDHSCLTIQRCHMNNWLKMLARVTLFTGVIHNIMPSINFYFTFHAKIWLHNILKYQTRTIWWYFSTYLRKIILEKNYEE